MWKSILFAGLVAGASARWVFVEQPTGVEISRKTATIEELNREFAKMREGCFKKPSGGCDCNVEREDGTTGLETFEDDEECYKDGVDSSSSSSSQESSSSSEDSTESDSASAEMERDEAALEAMVRGAEEGTKLSRKRRAGKTGVLPPGQLDSSDDDDDDDSSDDDDKRVLRRFRRDRSSPDDDDDNSSPDDDDKRLIRRHRRDRGSTAVVTAERVGTRTSGGAKRAQTQMATARANYEKVVKQLKKKFKDLREGCWPLPKGCKCEVDLQGNPLPKNDRGEVPPEDLLKYKKADDVHKCYTTGVAPDLS